MLAGGGQSRARYSGRGALAWSCFRWRVCPLFRLLAIAIGGALGALARYAVATLVNSRTGNSRFSWGTFLINTSACFLIGFVLTLFARRPELNPLWRYFIPIGFVGAYSTFSTFEWEIFFNLENGAAPIASLYLLSSLVCGLAAVGLGAWAGRAGS